MLPSRWLRRNFGFSRRETSGFVGLLGVLLGVLVLPLALRPYLPRYQPATDQRRLDLWAAELAAQRPARLAYASRYARRRAGRPPRVPQVSLTAFDPNHLSVTDWQARGLPAWLAERLVKYRVAVKGFRAKEQIRRAYGLSAADYARLAPYMQLPERLPARPTHTYASSQHRVAGYGALPEAVGRYPRKPRHLSLFDLNAADTTQLMQIRGIGRGRAARIVAYRQRLGGFRHPNQLTELYTLRDAPDLVDSLRKYTFVQPGFVLALLDVNHASFTELQAHPYVGKRLARVLVAFREQHGPFQQLTDLRQIRILDDAMFEKLQPYVVIK